MVLVRIRIQLELWETSRIISRIFAFRVPACFACSTCIRPKFIRTTGRNLFSVLTFKIFILLLQKQIIKMYFHLYVCFFIFLFRETREKLRNFDFAGRAVIWGGTSFLDVALALSGTKLCNAVPT